MAMQETWSYSRLLYLVGQMLNPLCICYVWT